MCPARRYAEAGWPPSSCARSVCMRRRGRESCSQSSDLRCHRGPTRPVQNGARAMGPAFTAGLAKTGFHDGLHVSNAGDLYNLHEVGTANPPWCRRPPRRAHQHSLSPRGIHVSNGSRLGHPWSSGLACIRMSHAGYWHRSKSCWRTQRCCTQCFAPLRAHGAAHAGPHAFSSPHPCCAWCTKTKTRIRACPISTHILCAGNAYGSSRRY